MKPERIIFFPLKMTDSFLFQANFRDLDQLFAPGHLDEDVSLGAVQ